MSPAAPTSARRDDVPRPDRPAALQARSLYRFFRAGEEETLALQGVSLTVAAGELVVVTGPSGSGKSTLLSCLAGLDDPDGGSVHIEGRRISHRPEATRAWLRAARIGILTQAVNLFEQLTVAANVRLAQAVSRHATHPPVGRLLTSVGLAERARSYPSQLSGGEAARAGLAVALANSPAVLLGDEPTGELDSATEAEVLELLVATARTGVAVLLASHSQEVVAAADRVVALADGRVADGHTNTPAIEADWRGGSAQARGEIR